MWLAGGLAKIHPIHPNLFDKIQFAINYQFQSTLREKKYSNEQSTSIILITTLSSNKTGQSHCVPDNSKLAFLNNNLNYNKKIFTIQVKQQFFFPATAIYYPRSLPVHPLEKCEHMKMKEKIK
jgi:hypothetical protein